MKSESEILSALAKYCSHGERCLFDVRQKLQAEQLPKAEEQRIIERLLQEKFVDEKRFSRSFVHDKFRLNHWGRVKIAYELKSRGIPPEVAIEAIEAIDEDEYHTVLADLLKKKKRSVDGRSPQEIYQKLVRFASSRGFESELVSRVLKKMFKNITDE